jgi:hypothetical protein
MTERRDFKRRVRARMRRTGESYTAARANLLRRSPPTRPRSTHPASPGAQERRRGAPVHSPGSMSGGRPVHPFEHFTDASKRVLTLAQEEAQSSHHSYIGTEHLLLGLVREGDGIAARALRDLGVGLGEVRQTLATVLGSNERIVVMQIIPTSRVKRVIEIAFEEAQRRASSTVDTEHLLLGVMIEGDGVAAQVLSDLGATRDRITRRVEELGRARAAAPEPGTGEARPLPTFMSAEVQRVLNRARELAQQAGERVVTLDHLREALAQGGDVA